MNFDNNSENKYESRLRKPTEQEEAADKEAVRKLMEEIPDVKPVNKIVGWIATFVFIATLALPSLVWGVMRIAAPDVYRQMADANIEAIKSENGENRQPAEFPTSFDPATFPSQIEDWYNDHLPFRQILFKTQQKLDFALEKQYDEVWRAKLISFFHGDNGQNPIGTYPEITEASETETETETLPEFNSDIESGTESETLPEFETETAPSDCDHEYAAESIILQEPTCKDYGIIGYPCSKCDYVKKEYTYKSDDHDYEEALVEETPATCTEYGVAGHRCKICGKIGNRQYTAKLPHAYVSDVETPPFDCGTKYTETLTCTDCGTQKVEERIKKHNPGKVEKTVEPSYESYGYTLYRCRDCRGTFRADLKQKLYDTAYAAPVYHSDTAYEGRNKWLFYRGNNSEAYYTGSNIPSAAELAEYASTFQQLNDLCKQHGITLQISIWPNKEQVYSEYVPLNVVNKNKRVPRIVDYVTKNTDVNMIYPLKELMEAKPYWDTYFKYDTHWNNAGAFIGHQAMLESLGFETTDLHYLPVRELYTYDADYSSIVYDNATSLLYGPKADLISLARVDPNRYTGNMNYVVTYRPDVTVRMVFGGNGANDTSHSKSNGPNDVRFVMLADSYRVMALDYLRRDFTDCFMAHRDSVMQPEVVEAVKNADVLVIAAVERLEESVLATAKRLISILSE